MSFVFCDGLFVREGVDFSRKNSTYKLMNLKIYLKFMPPNKKTRKNVFFAGFC